MILVLLVIVGSAALYIGSTFYYSPLYKSITKAVAVIHPTKGNVTSGVVTFAQQKDGVLITAHLTGLTPGKHGFHIHEFGDCACDDAVCAGSHYNPTHNKHGSPTAQDRHVGDFGNVHADVDGKGTYEYIDKVIRLNGPHSIIGRAVIIHAKEDDFTTQPTGNAGARLGCGVIGIAKK